MWPIRNHQCGMYCKIRNKTTTWFNCLVLHRHFQQLSLLLSDYLKLFRLTGRRQGKPDGGFFCHRRDDGGKWRVNDKVLKPGVVQNLHVSPSPVGPVLNVFPSQTIAANRSILCRVGNEPVRRLQVYSAGRVCRLCFADSVASCFLIGRTSA